MDARAFAAPQGLRPRRRVKPAHDELHYVSISSATSKFGAECVSAPEEM